jgi:hypothetical protein
VRGVRASADPEEAAGKAGAGFRALGVWVERLAGERNVAGNAWREPMQLRAEVPVETGRMSAGIPSAVGVLDPGDFPEAFVVTKEAAEKAALAEGDSFLMVDGPWGPVVVPEEVAVRVEVAGEGAVMEVPEAAELPLAAETLEMAEEPVVAGEMKEGVVAPVVVEKEESVPLVVAPLAAVEPEAVAEVRVPEVVPGVEETHEVVVAPVVALEPEVKSVPEEVPVEEKTPEVVVPLVVSEPEVKVAVLEEPVVAALSEVVAPPEVVEPEAKEPEGAGRDAVGWRMPEPVAVAPPSRGPRVVMRLMLLVLLVLVGWLAYKAVVLKGH